MVQQTDNAKKGQDADFAAVTATSVTAPITGNITGNVTGDVTGNVTGGTVGAQQVITGDGAITVQTGQVILTKGSAAAITIAAPTVAQDKTEITVIAGSAQAHVITQGTVGFNAKGSSGTVTFTAAIGNAVTLRAYNGNWYTANKNGVTVA